MNVSSLKQHIIDNEDTIELLLDKAGFHHISDEYSGGIEYRCALKEDSNPTSVVVNKETLYTVSYSPTMKMNGDLITLIQTKKMWTFPKTVRWIADTLNFVETEETKVELPFGGFFKEIMKLRDEEYFDLQMYSTDILKSYGQFPNTLFLQDGIDIDTQLRFNIGYEPLTNRITVPWKSLDGSSIVGIMGRLNKRELDEFDNKYLPVINFPKSKAVFGYSENYHSILDKGVVMIGESEKHTMQLASKGLNVGLSIGGSSISQVQANHVKSLFTEKIIIMTDEDMKEEDKIHIGESLKMDNFFTNSVYYVQDSNNIYLPKGSKMSPADLPKQDLQSLLKNCLRKVG